MPGPHPRREALFWGEGRGRGTADFQFNNADSPGLMVRPRAAGACVRAPPLPPKRASAFRVAPTMTTGRAWNGRLLAGVRPRPSRAPHRSPGARPRWEAYAPHCYSAALTASRTPTQPIRRHWLMVLKSAELMGVKDSKKHTDKPPKTPGAASGLLWGRISSGPRQLWGGQARGASSPAHRRAHEGLQPGGPCPVNAHGA